MPGVADVYTDKMLPRPGHWALAMLLDGAFIVAGVLSVVQGYSSGWVGVVAGLMLFAIWTVASFSWGLQQLQMGNVYLTVTFPLSMGTTLHSFHFDVQQIVGAYRGDAGRNRDRYHGLLRWGRHRVVVVLRTGEKVTLGTRNPDKVVEMINQLYVKRTAPVGKKKLR